MIWHNCYNEGWKGVIVDDAFQHPAKFSRALIRNIYRHALERGWLKAGDRTIDPFGGVALGALDALRYGLHWTGCELEARFVEMGQRNIALWNETYSRSFPNWGTARLLQGDSRELATVIGGGNGVVFSPPYAESLGNGNSGIDWGKQADRDTAHPHGWNGDSYGFTPGQLGAMKAGGFEGAIGSPPFETQNSCNDPNYQTGRSNSGGPLYGDYGSSAGQLGAMKSGNFDAAISSPPYESSRVVDGATQNGDIHTIPEHIDSYGAGSVRRTNDSIGDFWQAARLIVEQVYQVLTPGAVSIWVCKDFVRNKQRVPFSEQWVQLCEAVGFQLIEWHQASLVIDNGTQLGMFGDDVDLVKERKSFFRRLAEKKGSPRIDHEDVLCLRRGPQRTP